MKSMYKLVSLFAALGLLLAACATPTAAPAPVVEATQPPSAPEATKAPEPTAAPSGEVIPTLGTYIAHPEVSGTVTFSNCWGGSRLPLIELWIQEFNVIYPNIKVVNDTQACDKLFQNQVTQLSAGDAPNVMMMQSFNFLMMKKTDSLMPLNDLIARDKVDLDAFYAPELNARTIDGSVYGLPNVTAGGQHLLFYNTTLLEKVGWDPTKPIETWQDLDSLVAPAKEQGLFVMDPAKLPDSQSMFTALLYANGGKLWSDDLKTITWNSPEGLEAAEWELQFIKAQAAKYEDLAIAGKRNDIISAPSFGAEKYIAALNGSWFFFQLKNEAPQVKYGVSTFPRNANNPNSKGYTFIEGGWAFAIPAGSKDVDAAWEWVKFTTASRYTCDFVAAQNRPSPLKMCNEDPRLVASTPYWNLLQTALGTGQQIPMTDIHVEFKQILLDMEDAIIYEKMTPKEALDTFAAKAQAKLDEWNKNR